MMIKFVITELKRRKSEWADFSKITGISTKTIYRIANSKTDPAYSSVDRLHKLLESQK